jgi:hypothetical protein
MKKKILSQRENISTVGIRFVLQANIFDINYGI